MLPRTAREDRRAPHPPSDCRPAVGAEHSRPPRPLPSNAAATRRGAPQCGGPLNAMSKRVAEIYAELGVVPERLTTMQLTLPTSSGSHPRSRPGNPLTSTRRRWRTSRKEARYASGRPATFPGSRPEDYRLLSSGGANRASRVRSRGSPPSNAAALIAPSSSMTCSSRSRRVHPFGLEEAYGYAGVEFKPKASR